MGEIRLKSRLALPTSALYTDAKPLSNRLRVAVIAAISPILLTFVLIGGYIGIAGSEFELSRAITDTAYGLAAIGVLTGVYLYLGGQERRAVMNFKFPDWIEIFWALICLPLAIGAFRFGTLIGGLFGFELVGFDYSLADPATFAAVVIGGIIIAPFVEESLYRGLLLGSLLGRGMSVLTASVLSILLFAGLHVFTVGIAGVLGIAGLSIFPTLLRLKFNNLTGAWLLHVLNNIYAYILVVVLDLV